MSGENAGKDPKGENDLKVRIDMTGAAAEQLRAALRVLHEEFQRRLIQRAAKRDPPQITDADVLAERSAMLARPAERVSLRVPIARVIGRYVGLSAAGLFFGVLNNVLLRLPSWVAVAAGAVASVALAVEIVAAVAGSLSPREH